jgi:hypothetical protein
VKQQHWLTLSHFTWMCNIAGEGTSLSPLLSPAAGTPVFQAVSGAESESLRELNIIIVHSSGTAFPAHAASFHLSRRRIVYASSKRHPLNLIPASAQPAAAGFGPIWTCTTDDGRVLLESCDAERSDEYGYAKVERPVESGLQRSLRATE